MKNKTLAISLLVLTVLIGGYLLFQKSPRETTTVTQSETAQVLKQEATNFTTLTSAKLATMLQQKDFFFANVHIPYEGEIKNTDVFIPYDKIAENLDKLPKDKNAKIVLYCRSGRMSEMAARELATRGYTQVSHLSGGMNEWEREGNSVIRK